MTQTTDPRAVLERELGARLPALDVLSDDQCADLLSLLETTPRRDRAKARQELAEKNAARPRPVRALVGAVLLGRRS
ncbi:hypothetical protein [Nocardia sp. NPDC006630]|uniref:hypothetical protein n=1 Tax=Nocardia sp. NPDC006630 TaxID=3157181 RepID=UPI0033A1A91C